MSTVGTKTRFGPKIPAGDQLEGRDFLGQWTPEISDNLNFFKASGFWMFSQRWVFGLFGLESGLEGQL